MKTLEFNEIGKAYDFELEDNLEGFLVSKGIEFPELFLNPYNLTEETSPFNFHNMKAAVDIYNHAIQNEKKIAILVDDDADGYSSSASMLKYIHITTKKQADLIFHEDKSHGLTEDVTKQILNSDYNLIIIPDSASNDFDNQELLLEKGFEIIILDHHEMDIQNKIEELRIKYPYSYALVNNKLNKNKEVNKNFVGAGVVYKFCQALDHENEVYQSEELLDLIAMGQIGDASDIADYEIRNIVRRGLDNIISPLLKEIFNDDIVNGKIITAKNLSFSIIPMANATSRIGNKDDKRTLVNSLAGIYPVDEFVDVERRRKSKITNKMEKITLKWNRYTIALDELTKLKSKQDRTINKVVKNIGENVFSNIVTIVESNESDIEHRSLTGLLANRIANQNETPTLVLVLNDDGTYSGSARGFEKSIEDFRKWCNDTDLFIFAQGHANAFGVAIENENLNKLKEKLLQLDESGTDNKYDVDKIYHNESNIGLVTTINEHEELFGGSIKEPVYGYKDLVIGRSAINQRGSVVSFYHDGLEFIAYKQEAGLIDDFIIGLGFEQFVTVDLVGSPSKNTFTGQLKHQIVLKDYAIRPGGGSNFSKKIEKDSWIDESGELSF